MIGGILEYRLCQWVLVKVGLQLWCVAQTCLLIWVRFTIQTYTCMLVQRISVALNIHVTYTYCLIQSLFAIVGTCICTYKWEHFEVYNCHWQLPFQTSLRKEFHSMNVYIVLLCVYMYICVCVLERKGRKCRYCVSYLHCVCGALGQVRREREREKPLPWLKLTEVRWWLLSPNLYEEAWGRWVHVLDLWHLLRYFLSVCAFFLMALCTSTF